MLHRPAIILCSLLALTALAGCSESTENPAPSGSASSSTSSSSGGESGSGGSGGSGGSSTGSSTGTGTGSGGAGGSGSGAGGGATGSGGGSSAKVVINEIEAFTDWVELYNAGNAPADLSGFGVADTDTNTMAPKLADAVFFPDGTTLAPGAYLLVVGKVAMPMPGPQTTCLAMGGPPTCYQAAWGISDKNGEKLYLLNPDKSIAEEVPYPPNAAMTGQSWGRLPDGNGNFAVNMPTPGGANKGP
jgi:hypothetical protein